MTGPKRGSRNCSGQEMPGKTAGYYSEMKGDDGYSESEKELTLDSILNQSFAARK